MKNLVYFVFFFFLSVQHSCCAMVKSILISNLSSKKYDLRVENQFQEIPANEERHINLMWFFTDNEERGDSNIEFYDTSDQWYVECKKRKLCSLILYSHIYTINNKRMYSAKLERKKPEVTTAKDFAPLNLCRLQRLKLTITDDLEASELTLVD